LDVRVDGSIGSYKLTLDLEFAIIFSANFNSVLRREVRSENVKIRRKQGGGYGSPLGNEAGQM